MLADETEKKTVPARAGQAQDGLRMDGLRMLDVRDLVADGRELVLVHNGEHYRLRITSKGKLILTK